MTRLTVLALSALAVLAIGACRKEEQNRPTAFTPGVYAGDRSPALTKDQITELNKRGKLLK